MDLNWLGLGIIACCAIILVVYLIRKNLNDKKEVPRSLIDQFKSDKKFKLDDDDEN